MVTDTGESWSARSSVGTWASALAACVELRTHRLVQL
jgi:hypothetical protein